MKFVCMVTVARRLFTRGCALPCFAPEIDKDKTADQQERGSRGDTEPANCNGGVLTSGGIPVITEEQNLIERRADLVLSRFNQSKPEVFGRVFDAVVILGHLALRSHDHNGAGMSELIGVGVVLVFETHRTGKRLDR